MKYFRYYWHNPQRCESVAGLIIAENLVEARKALQKNYTRIDTKVFEITEVKFSEYGCYEVFYG